MNSIRKSIGLRFASYLAMNAFTSATLGFMCMIGMDFACAALSRQAFESYAAAEYSYEDSINENVWECSQKSFLQLIANHRMPVHAAKCALFGCVVGILSALINVQHNILGPVEIFGIMVLIAFWCCCVSLVIGGISWAMGGTAFGEFFAVSTVLSFSLVHEKIVFGWMTGCLCLCNIWLIRRLGFKVFTKNNSISSTFK